MSGRSSDDSSNARGRYDYDEYYESYELRVMSYYLLVTGYWLRATGFYWLRATSYYLLATGYFLLVTGTTGYLPDLWPTSYSPDLRHIVMNSSTCCNCRSKSNSNDNRSRGDRFSSTDECARTAHLATCTFEQGVRGHARAQGRLTL